MFAVQSQREIIILALLNFSSENTSSLDQSKLLLFGKELKPMYMYMIRILLTRTGSVENKQTTTDWKFVWPICHPHWHPFPNKLWLLRVYSTIVLKTPWEKEKLLFFLRVVKSRNCVIKS